MRQFPFVPCIEPKGGLGERFLTEHPRTLLQRGQVAPVPIIVGVNDEEGMVNLTGKLQAFWKASRENNTENKLVVRQIRAVPRTYE